jgi:hypothetical protein
MIGKRPVAIVILLAVLLIPAAPVAAVSVESSGLKIYLPREVAIKDRVIHLGDIAITHGDENLIRKTEGIALGNISTSGQEIVLDRYTIMARLGSSGIDASVVTFTGAERTSVTFVRKSIGSAELMVAAERFASRLPLSSDQRLHALDIPADVNISDSDGKLGITPTLNGTTTDNPLVVRLAIVRDGKELATREVRFVPVPRNPRQALAAKPAAAPNAPKIVFRNQPVVILIELPGLKVTAMGLPLEDGKAGQFIKVKNLDSKRDIIAQVKSDGTVAPVL